MKRLLLALALCATATLATAQSNQQVEQEQAVPEVPSVLSSFYTSIDCDTAQPTILSISGCPLTPPTSTFTITFAPWAANMMLLGPASGAAAIPTLRVPVPDDLALSGTNGQSLQISSGVLAWAAASSTTIANDTIWDTKGDIVAATAADTATKLAVGSDGKVLTAASGQATGLTWSTPLTIATDTTWAAKGDIIGATANDAAAVLTVGANDSILMAESGETTGLKWNAAATTSEIADASATAEAAGTSDTYARGDHVHLIPAAVRTDKQQFVILSPGAAENVGGLYFTAAATITNSHCVVAGPTSPSVTSTFNYGTDRTSATAVTTSPTAVTSTTTGSDAAALNNTAIPASGWVWLTTSAQTGSVTALMCTLTWTTP